MNNLDLLTEVIEKRKPISFEYNKAGKTAGTRIGNVHAVFIFTAKSGVQSTKVHIVQTAGISDSKEEKPFPDFRSFNLEELSNIMILDKELCFEPFYDKYNPEWEGYNNSFAKV